MTPDYEDYLDSLVKQGGSMGLAAQNELEKLNEEVEKKKKVDYGSIIPERSGDPVDTELYNQIKREAKAKFDVYPSAVANAWLSREYKKRGGKYGPVKKSESVIDLPPGHTVADVERHDEGHDNWHAMHGDPPCKDEADCARMRASYKDDDGTEVQKRDVSEAERERLADKGNAMPDGSYPIANVSDLKNAIQAYGRAKDKEAVKAHIKSRAKELGAEDLLPENW
jgi:hypothetical protein